MSRPTHPLVEEVAQPKVVELVETPASPLVEEVAQPKVVELVETPASPLVEEVAQRPSRDLVTFSSGLVWGGRTVADRLPPSRLLASLASLRDAFGDLDDGTLAAG